MFVDDADIILKAGHGGPGKVSFFPGEKSGPDGGNGGRGGDVYVKATTDLMALQQYTYKKTISAGNGEPGGRNTSFGENGKDIEILMPVGTLITDKDTGEEFEITDRNQRFLICKGGLGGRGNAEFKSSVRTTPKFAQPGLPGQERKLHLNLRLIAEFGLIGLPNAGKSSLLNELTKANAKVANYPFTTLEPNLGVLDGKILADIPGLIEGASDGKGLGIKFLKHIEKTSKLLHCITAESDDLLRDYQIVRNELEKFSPELKEKEEIILITKSDLVDKKELEKKEKSLKKTKKKILIVSIHDWDSLESLKKALI